MKYLVTTLAALLIGTAMTMPSMEEEKTELCSDGICVVQFNAKFNAANEVQWLDELTDCTTTTVDIMADPSLPNDYKIVVVPTIIVMEDGEEIERFQANIMMSMEATKEDVQESIDNIIMSKF